MNYVPFALLLSVLLTTATAIADESKTGDQDTPKHINVGKLFQDADQAGTLPDGVVVRVKANMALADTGKEQIQFQECWEFTATEVHRVVTEEEDNEVIFRREKSRPFDSARLCHDLAQGRVLEIHANKGPGERVHFALTDFHLGERSIEILVNGKSVLTLHESCLFAGYREHHARAFATLYERLASQARAVLGGRYIEVLVDTKHALDLHEHCTGAGYSETHARAFAKLYETLASQARNAYAKSEVRSPLQ